jgi:hypothetical protein
MRTAGVLLGRAARDDQHTSKAKQTACLFAFRQVVTVVGTPLSRCWIIKHVRLTAESWLRRCGVHDGAAV